MFRNFFANIPTVVKILLLINIAMFVLSTAFPILSDKLAVYSFHSPNFQPVQLISHMFMHGNWGHLFFNMFALLIFGRVLEFYWGSKRFFVYYFIAGIGGALFYLGVKEYEIQRLFAALDPAVVEEVLKNGTSILQKGMNYIDPELSSLNLAINVPCVGASGAIYGLLLAFGVVFPNERIYIYFLIPLKAKWFVLIYGGLELFYGVTGTADGVAHFAHLGGMLFGLIVLLVWRKQRNNYEN